MAETIYLTEHFTYTTTDSARQPLYRALEVGRWDALDLTVVATFDNPIGTFTISILTGMQRQNTSDWVLSGTFPGLTSSAPIQKLTLSSQSGTPFMRYITWSSSGQGATWGMRFMIYGTGRNYR